MKDCKLFWMFPLKIICFRTFWISWYAYRKIIKNLFCFFKVSTSKSGFCSTGEGGGGQKFMDMSATIIFLALPVFCSPRNCFNKFLHALLTFGPTQVSNHPKIKISTIPIHFVKLDVIGKPLWLDMYSNYFMSIQWRTSLHN